jgi:hypothetical protein
MVLEPESPTMKWFRILAKLVRLPRSEMRDLVLAQWAVLRSQVSVWIRPRGELLEMTNAGNDEWGGHETRAMALDLAVGRVIRFGVLRPQCLVRALALHRLLRQDGIRGSRVRIGVKVTDSGFSAHAWVVWGSIVLGDDVRHVRQFATITDGLAASSL